MIYQVDIKPSQFGFLVEDDGCGIPPASFGQLATRHATSKLKKLDDLVKGLDTLGFRWAFPLLCLEARLPIHCQEVCLETLL